MRKPRLSCPHCKAEPKMPLFKRGYTITMILDPNAVDFCEKDNRWYHRVLRYTQQKRDPNDHLKLKTEHDLIRDLEKELKNVKKQTNRRGA